MNRPETAQLFYDPFAKAGEQHFDPLEAHQAMWQRYANGEVEHDYTADKFVADTEALMLDAQFVGRFEAAQDIAARMHVLCGEDHGLQQDVAGSSLLGEVSAGHDHDHDTHADDKKSKHKDGKSKKKKKKFRSWFRLAQ